MDIIENVIKDFLMSRYFKSTTNGKSKQPSDAKDNSKEKGKRSSSPRYHDVSPQKECIFVIKRVKRSGKSFEDLRTIQSKTREDAVMDVMPQQILYS